MANEKLGIFWKTIEVKLETSKKVYSLDKYQVLNDKNIIALKIPNLNFTFYAAANYGGTGTYTTNVESMDGKGIARVEAINGAYLTLVNNGNQNVTDPIPLMLYRQDPEFFTEKGIFRDEPFIDFTQSKIVYPSNSIPNAENGRSIMLIIGYKDKYIE